MTQRERRHVEGKERVCHKEAGLYVLQMCPVATLTYWRCYALRGIRLFLTIMLLAHGSIFIWDT